MSSERTSISLRSARAFDVPPPIVYALANVLMLAATAFLLHRAARLAGMDRTERLLGVLLAVYGVSAFSRGPLWLEMAAVALVCWVVGTSLFERLRETLVEAL